MADKSFQTLLEKQRESKVKEQVAISQAAQTYALQQQAAVTRQYKEEIASKQIGVDAFNMVRDFIGSMDGLADASGFQEFRSTMEEWKIAMAELDKTADTGPGAFSNPEKKYVSRIVGNTLAEVYPMANMFTRVKFGMKDFLKQFKPLKLSQRLFGGLPIVGGMIERKVQEKEAGEERVRGAQKVRARRAGVEARKALQRQIDVATGEDFGEAGIEEIEKERPAGVGAGLKTLKKGAAGEEQREELIAKEEEQHTEIVDKLDAIVANTGEGGVFGKNSEEQGGLFETIKDNLGSIVGYAAGGFGTLKLLKYFRGGKFATTIAKGFKSVLPKSLFKAAALPVATKTTKLAKTVAPAAAKIGVKTTAMVAEKAAKETTEKVVKKEAAEAVSKAAAKSTTKVVATTTSKAVAKSAMKKIPVFGFFAGLGFGMMRMAKGDFTGAAMEIASGTMGAVPGIGTGGSIATDVLIAKRDIDMAKAKAAAESGQVADGAVEEAVSTENVANEKINEEKIKKVKRKHNRFNRTKSLVEDKEPILPSVVSADMVTIESKRTNVRAQLETENLENIIEKMFNTGNNTGNNTVVADNKTISTLNSHQFFPALNGHNLNNTVKLITVNQE